MKRIDPNNFDDLGKADYFLRRGMSSAQERRYDLAVADLSQAIELKPGLSTPYIVRAIVYSQAGRPDLGENDLVRAEAINPYHPWVIEINRPGGAITSFQIPEGWWNTP